MQEHNPTYAIACQKLIGQWAHDLIQDWFQGMETNWCYVAKFKPKPKEICFAFASNGMNPFGDFNLKHLTWPMLLLMYSLPPCLVTNKFCHVGSHHPWKRISEGCNMDTYRHPWLNIFKSYGHELPCMMCHTSNFEKYLGEKFMIFLLMDL
jgi:hypothetical protein